MRLSKGFAPLLFVGFAGLAWMMFLSEPASRWATQILNPPHTNRLIVGRVVNLEGQLNRISDGQVEKLSGPLSDPIEVRDGDRLEIAKNGRALLILNSQDEFELGSLSAVQLQLWDKKDASSAIYMVAMSDATEHRKAGVKGKAYVVRDGRLYLPGQRPSKKAMALTVLRSAPLDLQIAAQSDSGTTEFAGDDSDASDAEAQKVEGLAFGTDPETLSNEYIDETIATRQSQFQKCWLPRLKDNPNLRGKVILQFEITRRGKVRDLRITDSSLNDETLQKCVMQVVERMTFRPFKGPEISLSYPLIFE